VPTRLECDGGSLLHQDRFPMFFLDSGGRGMNLCKGSFNVDHREYASTELKKKNSSTYKYIYIT